MVANSMMLLALRSQLRDRPSFDVARRVPVGMDEAHPAFKRCTERFGLREALELIRSPEIAAALALLTRVLQAQRGRVETTGSLLPQTAGR
ncbi:MAG: hypothetical protein ACK42I_00220 [Thermomicrobium sp.]